MIALTLSIKFGYVKIKHMVRTRFAPSPTGFLHVGNLRTALYAYAMAKSQAGRFLLRIEDTDQRRYVPESVEGIYKVLRTFNLQWDEGPKVGGPYAPYIQSERVKKGIYQKYVDQLIEKDHAYYCFCQPVSLKEIKASQQKKEIILRDSCRDLDPKSSLKKVAKGEKAAVRLRVPDGKTVSFTDFIINKEISWETDNVDEVTLLKSDGFPTYHLAAMVDDYEMKISHVIRGRDWLPSTPAHLLLFEYLGITPPKIGHPTDIMDPEGGKLSKRKGSVNTEEMLADGFLPEAILNFIMLLGWGAKGDREFFTLEEFVKEFQKGELQVSNPVFNRKKLDWFNGMYIRQKTDLELSALIKPFMPKGMPDALIKKTAPLVKERLRKLSEFSELTDFFVKTPKIDPKILVQKGGQDKKLIKKQLTLSAQRLAAHKSWQPDSLEKLFRKLAANNDWHVGKYFMALRIAVTGKTATPPLFETMAVLGQKETLTRLTKAAKTLT